jgi:hypothetical protein
MTIAAFLKGLTGSAQAPAAASAPAAPAQGTTPEAQAGTTTTAPAPTADPLEQWAKLFTSEAPKPGTTDEKKTDAADPFAVSPEALAKAASGINLSQVVTPELAQKALGGDPNAFVEAINKSSQMTFMMAYQAAMQAVKAAMDNRFQDFQSKVPDTFKQLSVDATLQGDPLLSNPALKPVVDGLRTQILSKHPDATPQQLQQAISEYFKAIGISLTPGKNDAKDAAKPSKGIDWDNFLSLSK